MDALDADAAALLNDLRGRGLTLAVCESLTAGMLSATLANISGASAVLRGGLVTYATELKSELAGVDPQLLRLFGPISPECASAMARGARTACGADMALALTGVAGPDRQDGHPVGEVWMAVATAKPQVWVRRMSPAVALRRQALREQAVAEVLAYARQVLRAEGDWAPKRLEVGE
ncbi:Putative competence-damage inducible protein [Corynebacterium ciconiae DSM 44920]|uniref:CinA family protein n=1 Tax=Corynebacterium ciconiae TaxID=227319 RepID=UPI0003708722|nr:CinA family protein [Corynebacterium ciconiae]WKD61419.1 Putative competence-damage inducible protein [Corynebacterium ciconiae DSM 44920]